MSDARTISNGPRRLNRLGLAALILGLVALAGALIPFVNVVSVVLALVGVILAVVALSRRPRPRLLVVVGLIVSGFALLFAAVTVTLYTIALVTVGNAASTVDASRSVVYDVTGDGDGATVIYTAVADGAATTKQVSGRSLPYSAAIPLEPALGGYDLVATAGSDATTITCRIEIAGKVVSTRTATGPNATASCHGSR